MHVFPTYLDHNLSDIGQFYSFFPTVSIALFGKKLFCPTYFACVFWPFGKKPFCDACFFLLFRPQFVQYISRIFPRGGVEDTRLEAKAKAKDTKKIRGQGQGQGQPFRGQNLSRPRTGMLEAKAKDQGHWRKCSPKKKKVFKIFFRQSPFIGVPRIFDWSKPST